VHNGMTRAFGQATARDKPEVRRCTLHKTHLDASQPMTCRGAGPAGAGSAEMIQHGSHAARPPLELMEHRMVS
jgi:hypothetical protein